jgi:hypothetical protein
MNNTRLYTIIALLILALLVQRSCNRKQLDKAQTATALLQLDQQQLQKKLNKRGDTIAIQQAALIADKKAFKRYSDSVFGLQKKMGATLAFYKQNMQTRIDTFEAVYTKHDTLPVYITDSFARMHMLQVPACFAADSAYYSIAGAVRMGGVSIYNIGIKDTLTGRFVEGKKRLFRPRLIEYQAMNANPFVQINGMNSASYKPRRRSIIGPILLVGIGIVGGFVLAH